MAGPRGFHFGEPAAAPRQPDEPAHADAAEGDCEQGEERRLPPLARADHASGLHPREDPDSRERQQKHREAADRAVHPPSPVTTGVSLRRPHSLHDPS
jgi:hypothetical protein